MRNIGVGNKNRGIRRRSMTRYWTGGRRSGRSRSKCGGRRIR